MAKLGISTGSTPNDGTGDSLLSGAIKINSNFNEIYNAIGNGTTITNRIAYASTAGFSTTSGYATTSGTANYSVVSGVSTYSSLSGIASASNYANTSGISTVAQFAQNLTGTPNISAGVITASSYFGSGANLSGIITSIQAGSNVSVAITGSVATISATGTGGGSVSSQWLSVVSGIVTSSNVGIGTTIANSALQVNNGTISLTGTPGSNVAISLRDNHRLTFGDSGTSDSSIFFDGTELNIRTSGAVNISDNSGRDVFSAVAGEGAILYYDNSKKFQTLTDGAYVDGNLGVLGIVTATNLIVSGVSTFAGIITSTRTGDNGATFKSTGGKAYTVLNSATNFVSFLDFQENGILKANVAYSPTTSGALELNSAVPSNVVIATGGGNVAIGTTNATSKLTVQGTLSVSGVSTFQNGYKVTGGNSYYGDNVRLYFGNDSDIFIGHQTIPSPINYIAGANNIPLTIWSDNLTLGAQNGENFATFTTNGSASLYHDNSKKFETTSTGAVVTGVLTATSFSGSNTLKERLVVSGVTTSIANNGIGNTNITGFKSYALMKVGLSTAGWLRLYTDSESRDNDVFRSVGEDPAPGSGVIAEVVTTGISTTQIISPFVMGGNLDNPADTTIYAAITNLSGSTQAITANLTILQLEA